jgi:hypothetical protein
MFKRNGDPPRLIVDGSKEETLGRFKRKYCEAGCHLIATEPYCLWQQAAEGCIKHLKKASSRKFISSGSPKTLWDYCIELMALIRSHTALTSYELQGEVPETIMTSQMVDTSNIYKYD